ERTHRGPRAGPARGGPGVIVEQRGHRDLTQAGPLAERGHGPPAQARHPGRAPVATGGSREWGGPGAVTLSTPRGRDRLPGRTPAGAAKRRGDWNSATAAVPAAAA